MPRNMVLLGKRYLSYNNYEQLYFLMKYMEKNL